MSDYRATFITEPIESSDVDGGFSCGVPALDDYFSLQALEADTNGVERSYVLRLNPDESDASPFVLGFYTLSFALAVSEHGVQPTDERGGDSLLVAVIERLAVDKRALGRHLGEALLMDALRRVVSAAGTLGCRGVVATAKDEAAKSFYANYDFVAVTHGEWPRRMFLPIALARAVLSGA